MMMEQEILSISRSATIGKLKVTSLNKSKYLLPKVSEMLFHLIPKHKLEYV